jgi:hypothetical protein
MIALRRTWLQRVGDRVPSLMLTTQIVSVISTLTAVGILDICEEGRYLCMILFVGKGGRWVPRLHLGWGQAEGFA